MRNKSFHITKKKKKEMLTNKNVILISRKKL